MTLVQSCPVSQSEFRSLNNELASEIFRTLRSLHVSRLFCLVLIAVELLVLQDCAHIYYILTMCQKLRDAYKELAHRTRFAGWEKIYIDIDRFTTLMYKNGAILK